MKIDFKDVHTNRREPLIDADLLIISNKAKELKEKNKAIIFNYKDTEDYKRNIPDFTGFKQRIYQKLKIDHPTTRFMIRSYRETGNIEVILLELDIKKIIK